MDRRETGKGRGSSLARLPRRAVEIYRTQGGARLLRSTIRFAQRLLLGRVYAFLLRRVELELADCPGTLIAGCLYRVTLRIRRFRLPIPSWSTTLLIRYAFTGGNGQSEGGEMLPLGRRQPSGTRDFELGALVDTPGRPGDYDLTVGFAVDAPFASFFVPLTRQVRVAAHEDALMASAMPALDVTMDVTNRCIGLIRSRGQVNSVG